jgi:hypothetical protein
MTDAARHHPTGKYDLTERRSITIFGGYPVRTIVDPQGKEIITVALIETEGVLDLAELLNHLNRGITS